MACQEYEGNCETPDRSLGSLSLNATGEQLDDIQFSLDRSYLSSPAPSSLGSMDYGTGTPTSVPGATGFRKSGLLLDSGGGKRIDPEAFDKLALLDDEVLDSVDSVDWLTAPPTNIPSNFDEDDRSFLDTNLLYKRFNLLNFVTRVINEEIYAETRKNCPPSPLTNSNLCNESAGSGATFRVNRTPRRGLLGNRRTSDGADDESSPPSEKSFNDDSGNMSAISSLNEGSENSNLSEAEQRRQKYLTYRRGPMQRHREVTYCPDAQNPSNPGSPAPVGVGSYVDRMQSKIQNGRYQSTANSTFNNGRQTSEETFNSSGSNLDDDGFIPDDLSPTGPSGGCRLRGLNTQNTITPPFDNQADSFAVKKAPINPLRNPFEDASGDDEAYSPGSFSHEIDTRTYTRPKKSRVSMSTPNRVAQLNAAMSISPSDSSPIRQMNATIDLSPVDSRRPMLGSNNHLNRTIEISPGKEINQGGHHAMNTTMNLGSDSTGEADNSANLNETFVTDNTPDRSRRVTRNLSYVVRRDEESPNNNASPHGQDPRMFKSDLNSTFSYDPDSEIGSPATKGSQNTSMEDLNSRVASQIRSLGCSTISRGKIPDGIVRGIPNLDETRLVARTSSTDTYSVAHSSESPNSSGLSSPMDAQSYDDIQTSDSSSVRRSMPNLALIRSHTSTRSGLPTFSQPGSGQLVRKNHYISDSKLSHLGSHNDRPRLSIHSTSSSNSATLTRGMRTPENLRARGAVDRNTSTPAALNRITSGIPAGGASRVHSAQTLGSATITRPSATSRQVVGGSMGNVRSSGLVAPRYTGAPVSTSGLRQTKPLVGAQASASAEGIRKPGGIPVPTFRTQTRIPAPGQLRFSRPPSKLPGRGGGANVNPTRSGLNQKGAVDDWRDGCY